MKFHILAAFNTNSRRLIRTWRSWGLIPSRNMFFFAESMCQCKTRKSRFRLNFALILHQNGADVMKLDILAAFNTNSRCLTRILRFWGLVGARKRKQGAARMGAGVGQICENMKIGKSWKVSWEWSGEVQTAKWSAQLSEHFQQQWKTYLFSIIFFLFEVSRWGHRV